MSIRVLKILEAVIEETERVENLYRIEIKIPQDGNVLPGDLYRELSNSKKMIGGETNRQYWKRMVKGGLYYYNSSCEIITIVFYLYCTKQMNIKNMGARIRKATGLKSTYEVVKVDRIYDLPREVIGMRLIGDVKVKSDKLKDKILNNGN